jgi:hypothetical protein
MATQPEIAPPDTIQPQSPPESPSVQPPVGEPGTGAPEIVPDQPDRDVPGGSPIETPQPPD